MKSPMFCTRHFFIALGMTALCLVGIAGPASASDVDALHEAAGDGKLAQVETLIKNGVDVNQRTRSGTYALNAAAVENEVDVIRTLLAHGANPNVQNGEGDTPLICATKYGGGKAVTVELLVKAGSDMLIRDNDGKTALDYAKAKGQRQAIAIMERTGN